MANKKFTDLPAASAANSTDLIAKVDGPTGNSQQVTLAQVLAFLQANLPNVTITAPGFAPTAPNDATKFLNGVGAYAVPATGGNPGTSKTLVAQSVAVVIAGGATTPFTYTLPANTLAHDGDMFEAIFVLSGASSATFNYSFGGVTINASGGNFDTGRYVRMSAMRISAVQIKVMYYNLASGLALMATIATDFTLPQIFKLQTDQAGATLHWVNVTAFFAP